MKTGKYHRFTLIELLVVIVIIATLMAMLLPALSRAKYQAYVTVCMNNQRQVAVGYIAYATDYDAYYPSVGDWDFNGYDRIGRTNSWTPDAGPSYQYMDLLTPYYGKTYDEANNKTYDSALRIFTCPLAPKKPYLAGRSVSSAWNYSVWPDTSGRGAIRYESTQYGHDRDRSNMMMKVGQPFNIDLGRSDGRKDCNILLSDIVKVGLSHRDEFGFGRVVSSNHFRPGFDRIAGAGYETMFWSGIFGAEGNYTLDDGSTRRIKLEGVPSNMQFVNGFPDWYVSGGQWEGNHMPAEGFENN